MGKRGKEILKGRDGNRDSTKKQEQVSLCQRQEHILNQIKISVAAKTQDTKLKLSPTVYINDKLKEVADIALHKTQRKGILKSPSIENKHSTSSTTDKQLSCKPSQRKVTKIKSKESASPKRSNSGSESRLKSRSSSQESSTGSIASHRSRRKALSRALIQLRKPNSNLVKKRGLHHKTKPRSVKSKRISRSLRSLSSKRVLRDRKKPDLKTPAVSPRKRAGLTPSKSSKKLVVVKKMEKLKVEKQEVEPEQHREHRGPTQTSYGEIQESSAIETNPEELFDKEFDSSSSSSDREMQVLEKQVVSDQEDDDYPPLHLPTSDEESALLSPSALPASDLFKPQPRRKKRISDSKLQSGSSKIGEDSPLQSFSTTATATSTSTQKYFLGSTSFPTTKSFLESSSSSGAVPIPRPTTLSVSSTKFSNSTSRFHTSKSMSVVPKRGRGRPRKPLSAADKKVRGRAPGGIGRGKPIYTPAFSTFPSSSYPQEDHERTPYDDNFDDDPMAFTTKTSYSGKVSKKQDLGKRMQRWKNRSTFIYAKHKFRNSGNGENGDASRDKFMCKVCKVGFTALSSLKRHYGTIYHKQQEQSGQNTLDFSATSSVVNVSQFGGNDSDDGNFQSSSPTLSRRGRGKKQPRTSSFVRRNAVDNIKKYYAAADAARRRRDVVGGNSGGTWVQKQPRQRKPLQHSDFVYQSSALMNSQDDYLDSDNFRDENDIYGEEEMGEVRDEDVENDIPLSDNDELSDSQHQIEHIPVEPWLSSAWKGIGAPHFTCEVCNESQFQNKREFTRHLFKHRQEEEKAFEMSKLTCPECNVRFPNETSFEDHCYSYKHGKFFRYKCNYCPSSFVYEDYLKKHMDHHRRPAVCCPHCPKKFSYKFYLQDHIKAIHETSTNGNGLLPNPNGPSLDIGTENLGGESPPPPPPVAQPLPILEVEEEPGENENQDTRSSPPSVLEGSNNSKSKVLLSFEGGVLVPADATGPAAIASTRRKSCTSANAPNPTSSRKRNSKSVGSITGSTDDSPTKASRLVSKTGDDDAFIRNQDSDSKPIRECKILQEENSLTPTGTNVSTSQSRPKECVNLFRKYFGTEEKEAGDNTTDSHGQKKEPSISTETNVLKDVTDVSNLVFQFQDSEHSVKVVPSITSAEGEGAELPSITIEIPRDNIGFGVGKIEEQSENNCVVPEVNAPVDPNKEQEVDKKPAIETPQKTPAAGMSMIVTSLKLLQNTDTSASTTSATGTSNSLPLIGCGCRNDILLKPLESPLVCQDCGKSFEHRKSLVKHVRYYSQSEDFHCTLCPKTFKLKHHVTRHMKSFHNIDTTSSTSSGAEEPPTDLDFLSSPSGSNSDGFLPHSSTVDKTPGSTSFEGQLFPATTTAASTSLSKRSVSSLSDRKRSPKKLRKRLESSPAVPNTHSNPPSTFTSSLKKKKASSVTSEPGGVAATTTPSTIQDILSSTSVVASDGMNVFKCLICKRLYPSKNQLSSHMWYHKKKSSLQYKCTEPDCSAEFKFKHDLNTHQQQMHNNSSSSTSIGLPERNKIVCMKCPVGKSKSFQSQKELMRHMREMHNMGRKRSISSSSSSLEKKAEVNEGGGEVDDQDIRTEIQVSRCPFCPLVFPRKKDLTDHMDKEHVQCQTCQQCGQVLGNSEQLKEHMSQDHPPGKDEECDNEEEEDFNDDEDDDRPPTPSPHPSPTLGGSDYNDEMDDEDLEEEEDIQDGEEELLDLI